MSRSTLVEEARGVIMLVYTVNRGLSLKRKRENSADGGRLDGDWLLARRWMISPSTEVRSPDVSGPN